MNIKSKFLITNEDYNIYQNLNQKVILDTLLVIEIRSTEYADELTTFPKKGLYCLIIG